MNFWTFVDRNGFGLFWIALALISMLGGVFGTLAANSDRQCQCSCEEKTR